MTGKRLRNFQTRWWSYGYRGSNAHKFLDIAFSSED